MSSLAIIPARGGSKGIPRKNIALVGGKPLIAWTIEAAIGCKEIARTVVSTDDSDIADVARRTGAEVVMRPAHLAADDTPTLPVLQHVVRALRSNGFAPEIVATLQPTSPLRTAAHLDAAFAAFAATPNATSLISVQRVPHQFAPQSLMEVRGGALYSLEPTSPTRRQEKDRVWARNGAAIYLTRIEYLDSFIWDEGARAFPMDSLASVDVDEPDDLIIADALLSHRRPDARKQHRSTNP